ncbi:MAG TPA: Gfo/Idh/MocA family oxidoreductase [Armatimonadota bacterium]
MPRIGLIGAGGIGRKHADAYSRISNAQLVGIADLDLERAASLAGAHGAKAYATGEALIAAEKPDVVDICVPTPAHADAAQAAIAARIPTILEKPVARTLAEGKALIAAFQNAGVPVLPAHVVRFFPDFFSARQQILAGVVGNPGTVRITRGGGFPRGKDNWYGDPDKSGGVFIDLMLHDFDWLRWTFGEVERVTANCLMASDIRGKDYALAILRFQSGVIAHVEGTWAHNDGFRTELEVAGDKGILDHSTQYPFAFRLRKDEAEARVAVPVPESPVLIEPYTAELSELISALTGGPAARVTAEDGLKALEIGDACWQSARTGQPVTI